MKYLRKDLYTECFYGRDYDKSEDKFLIGYLNNEGKKLKDVVTGQVVEGIAFSCISELRSFEHDGNQMSLGYMTGLRANEATIYQRILAHKINKILSKALIDEEDIIKIKNILNSQIIRNHEKEVKSREKANKTQELMEKYSISGSERDFK